jgi:hypothetical protein
VKRKILADKRLHSVKKSNRRPVSSD